MKTKKKRKTKAPELKVIELEKEARKKGLLPEDRQRFSVENETVENLRQQLALTFDLIPVAESAYLAKPTFHNCLALTRLIEVASGLMEKIEEARADEKREAIETMVLRPLITQTVAALSEELRSLREELKPKLKETYQDRLDQYVRSVLTRVGERLEVHYQDALKTMEKVLQGGSKDGSKSKKASKRSSGGLGGSGTLY